MGKACLTHLPPRPPPLRLLRPSLSRHAVPNPRRTAFLHCSLSASLRLSAAAPWISARSPFIALSAFPPQAPLVLLPRYCAGAAVTFLDFTVCFKRRAYCLASIFHPCHLPQPFSFPTAIPIYAASAPCLRPTPFFSLSPHYSRPSFSPPTVRVLESVRRLLSTCWRASDLPAARTFVVVPR